VDLDPLRSRIAAYARAAFPGLRPEPVGEVARLTTTLSSGDDDGFALRWTGPVGVFAGGNLFKRAPVLGARLAEAVLSEERRDWSEPAAAPRRPAEPLVARPRR
jgi:hypothetical protein